MSVTQSDVVREVLDRLDLEYQLAAERAMLEALEAHEVFEPSPEDVREHEDLLERIELERGCNARFV